METSGAPRGPTDRPGHPQERPLPHLPTGRPLKVVRIDGGRALTAHLADLGISVGAVVKVVRVGPFGPVMVRVGDSRYAIGRGAALKIWAIELGT